MKDLRSIAETAANWWADVACGNNTLHRDGTDELPNFFAGLIEIGRASCRERV